MGFAHNSSLSLLVLLSFASLVLAAPYNDSCVLAPQDPACSSYQLPSSVLEADISSLCNAMGNMPGCTVRKVCTSSSSSSHVKASVYCNPFSVYKDLCLDMAGMSGCADYRSMCQNGTQVKQCGIAALPLPSTSLATTLITSICNQMNMLSCSECISSALERGLSPEAAALNCDLLQVYSDLCLSMPGMTECTSWNTMCKVVPDWPLCMTGAAFGPAVPQMLMYFHTGIVDYILFKQWVPQNPLQYTLSWVAILVVTIFHEFIRMLRKKFERSCRLRLLSPLNDDSKTAAIPFILSVDVPRALLQALEAAWSLFIMLVAMTYNVGLFFAIVVGYFVGSLAFGRFIASYDDGYQIPSGACH